MTTPSLRPLPHFDSFRLSHFSTAIPIAPPATAFTHSLSFSSYRRFASSPQKKKVIMFLFGHFSFVFPSFCLISMLGCAVEFCLHFGGFWKLGFRILRVGRGEMFRACIILWILGCGFRLICSDFILCA